MMKHVRYLAIAMVCTGALMAFPAAQQDPARKPSTASGATMNQPAVPTTLVGCLYRESSIPGRTVAQPGSDLDDYILADAAIAGAGGGTGAVGTSGAAPAAGTMYEVERIAPERLSPLVGKRVEITGHIDADPDHLTGAARDVTDLPELETASIREVSGTCPATPKL